MPGQNSAGSVHYPLGRPLGLLAVEERASQVLLCQAYPASAEIVIEAREIKPPTTQNEIKNLPSRIERLDRLAPDVMAVFLRILAREQFNYLAGQYLDIMLPQNRRRSFSIANPPHDAELLELHVRRVSRGEFTQQLFSGAAANTLIRIEGPLGQFWFREESRRPALLIGGGTGYAPLRAMLRHLLERGDRRPLHLYWGAQSRVDLYEDALVREWTARYPNFKYTPVLSNPRPKDAWDGRTGLVHKAVLEDHVDIAEFDVYTAGPPAMIEAIRHEFIARGLPRDQLFFDSFDFAPDVLAKRARQLP